MAQPIPPTLTDRLLRSWLRCPRRAWLDLYGPGKRRRWTAHRALALDDQQRSFQSLLPQRPGHGEAAFGIGAASVVGVRLRGNGPGGTSLEAHPSLLERVEIESRWGPYGYRPALARQGRRVTREQRLLLTLWGRLLAEHQRAPVPYGLVVKGSGSTFRQERLALGSGLQRQLDNSLLRLEADLKVSDPPPLVSDRKKCALCGWRSLCDGQAAQEGHLSEVSGIGGRRREMLMEAGVFNLAQLAASDPLQLGEALAQHGDQHRQVAAQLVAQARVQLEGRPRRIAAGPALPELSRAPGILLYDIESDPDARDDFLHGLLRLERNSESFWPNAQSVGSSEGAASYHPVLALKEHGERRLWCRLRKLLDVFDAWPVLHYGETESIALLRLADRQGASAAERDRLRSRLVDVHERLRRHWLFPATSYGLKSVAGALGFEWSQKGVDGAQCLLWWRHWKVGIAGGRSPSPRTRSLLLRRILRYNREDCLATWMVAHWLLAMDS